MAYDTALNILNDAAIELGLVSAALANPYASTDANIVQLRGLLKGLGQDLWRDFQWSQLQKEYTLALVSATESYALPTDFGRFIDQTQWDRTLRFPLNGPLGPRGWQAVKALNMLVPFTAFVRIFGNRFYVYPTTSTDTIAFEYISRYWVMPDGQTSPTAETPSASTDTLWFDSRVLVTGLVYRFLSRKGLDSSAAADDFKAAVARAQGGDGLAEDLPITGRGPMDTSPSWGSAPITGFGFDGSGGLY